MEKNLIEIKLDKKTFSVTALTGKSDEKDYWITVSPVKRHEVVLRVITSKKSCVNTVISG